MKSIKFILISLTLFLCLGIEAVTISGLVKNEAGNYLENVFVKADDKITFTNQKGYFFLKNVKSDALIEFHKIGYENRQFTLKNLPYEVVLKTKSIDIDSLKVIGKRNSSNINSLNKEVIELKENSGEELDELLAEAADITIEGIALPGESKTVSILGHKSKYTVVMLNGIPLNRRGEAFDIGQIPVNLIEKIEIIRSGSSALSGDGSLGGTINIITKKTLENAAINNLDSSLNLVTGSYDLWRMGLENSCKKKNFQTYINISQLYTKNDFLFKELHTDTWSKRDNNQKKINTLNLNLESSYGNNFLNYNFLYRNFEKGLPGPISSISMFDSAGIKGESSYHQIDFERDMNLVNISNQTFYQSKFSKYDNRNSSNPYQSEYSKTYYHKWGDKLSFKYNKDKISLTAGADYFYESFEFEHLTNPQNSIDRTYLQDLALLLQAGYIREIYPFKLNLSSFLRYDYPFHSDSLEYKDFYSWRQEIKIQYESLIDYEIGFVGSNSYALPSFYELYWRGNSQTIGNPHLKPETAFSRSVFFKAQFKQNYCEFSYYHNEIDNMIYWYRSLNSWKPGNIADASIINYQLDLELQPFSFWKSKINYLRTIAKDKTIGEDGSESNFYNKNLIYKPKYQLTLTNEFSYKSIACKLIYKRIGKRYPTRDNLWGYLPEYDVFNTAVNLNIPLDNLNFKINLNLNNLLDNYYEKYQFEPQPGFYWSLGLKVDYKLEL